MKFFSKEQKELALKVDRWRLNNVYEETERELHIVAVRGDDRMLKETMAEHQLVEYALLYQLTPEYKEIIKKGERK